MFDLPDHPDIRNCEETGYPDRREDKEPSCPKCGSKLIDTIYKDSDGDIVGCDMCVTLCEPWEVL